MTAVPPQFEANASTYILITAGNRPLTSASSSHKTHSLNYLDAFPPAMRSLHKPN